MGLIMNTFRDSTIPFTQFGGISMSGEYPNFIKSENWLLTYLTESGMSKTTSMPGGNNHPNTWRMPLKAGAISSINRVTGSGNVVGTRTYGIAILATLSASGGISNALTSIGIAILSNAIGSGGISSAGVGEGRPISTTISGNGIISNAEVTRGIAILSNLSGTGGITEAIVSLLIQISAELSGNGAISSADLKAYLQALADLTGLGEITEADLTGLGELLSILDGVGIITSTLTATGELSADIKSYGVLTPEGLRDAVWQAAALNYVDPTTMGGKLNLASSGGVDYQALADAVWEALNSDYTNVTTMGGVIGILQTKLDELHKIQGLDIDNPLTITKDLRSAGAIDLELSSTGDELTIVTRQ